MISIEIIAGNPETRMLWMQLGELTNALPEGWVLVGGLMVQLHALEHSVAVARATKDIDLLGQARPPEKLQAIAHALQEANFELSDPDADGYGYRYERDGVIVDLLAPDGMKAPPTLGQGVKAIGIPGGSQALKRSELVGVTIEDRHFVLRRPTLPAAVLIKARSLMVHEDPASQREDLLLLLSLIPDPRGTAGEISSTERGWLTRAEQRLDLRGQSLLAATAARNAALAYRLLTAPSHT